MAEIISFLRNRSIGIITFSSASDAVSKSACIVSLISLIAHGSAYLQGEVLSSGLILQKGFAYKPLFIRCLQINEPVNPLTWCRFRFLLQSINCSMLNSLWLHCVRTQKWSQQLLLPSTPPLAKRRRKRWKKKNPVREAAPNSSNGDHQKKKKKN